MPAQPKATLEILLKLLGFEATVDEHPLEDGLLLDVKTEESGRLAWVRVMGMEPAHSAGSITPSTTTVP